MSHANANSLPARSTCFAPAPVARPAGSRPAQSQMTRRLSASRFFEILVVKRRRHSINLGLAQAMTAGFPSPVGHATRNVGGDVPGLDVLQLEIGSHLKRQ